MASEDAGPGAASAVRALIDAAASSSQEGARASLDGYDSLSRANQACAEEYAKIADVTSGLSVFVDALHGKNERLRATLAQVDEVDVQLTELEAVVATLDSFTASLEARIAAMPLPGPTQAPAPTAAASPPQQ